MSVIMNIIITIANVTTEHITERRAQIRMTT